MIWVDINQFEQYEISKEGNVRKKAYDYEEVRIHKVDGFPISSKRRFSCKGWPMKPRKDDTIALSKNNKKYYFDKQRLIDFHFNEEL